MKRGGPFWTAQGGAHGRPHETPLRSPLGAPGLTFLETLRQEVRPRFREAVGDRRLNVLTQVGKAGGAGASHAGGGPLWRVQGLSPKRERLSVARVYARAARDLERGEIVKIVCREVWLVV